MMISRRLFIGSSAVMAASPALSHHAGAIPHTEISRAALNDALTLPATITVGAANGDVTMIEFFDYNCGFCKQATRDLDALIKADKTLRVILVNYAVLGLPSILAGKVAVAMAMQKPRDYFSFHKALFASRGVIDAERALAVAKQYGGNTEDLTEAANSDAVTAVLKASAAFGNRLNLSATPSYIFASAKDKQMSVGHIPLGEKRSLVAALR
ncbi:MAG: DsbA family protein [Beijerinckiaceae bacterium]